MKYTLCALLFTLTVVTACSRGQQACGSNYNCYNPSTNTCTTDLYSGASVICGLNQKSCKKTCFDPTKYRCVSGQISSIPTAATPVTKAPTTSSTTSTTKAATTAAVTPAKSTTSATPVQSTTSVTPVQSTTSATPVQSTTAAAPVASSSSSGSGSTCYSGCPSGLCSCNGACYTPGQYNCPTDSFTGKLMLCQGNLGACNGGCYDSTAYTCSSGVLVAGGSPAGNAPVNSPSTTTANAVTPAPQTTTAASPVVNPTPAPVNGAFPTQTADLRIINSCKSTLWFEARYGGAGAPLPGQSATSLQALPGSYIDYTVPDTGLPGSRFWAKYGCDSNGQNCLIGDQMQYWPNPPGGCPSGGCTPPVDSLFEATWGCRPGSSCNSQNPTTWFDTSQVDGWTIPYKLTPVGDTSGCDCVGSQCGFKGVDASTLDLAKCPRGEDLTAGGLQSTANVMGQTASLSSVDLRIIKNNQVLGCMSPCKKLNWGAPFGLQQNEGQGAAMWMCCPTPTPDNCSPSNGCITPQACRAGPIENTQFVAAVHDMAPGVYSYSYDDGVGLHACPAGVTKYTMEFCPAGSATYPGTV